MKAGIEANPRNGHKPKRGRPYRVERGAYRRMRRAFESFFSWITSLRRITIRYERLVSTFFAFIQIAYIIK
ncbi:transposase [Candidatus Bathyarchaeota archaeon]|nr:transposase [Candidatus Bathyarchaeota archaeon]